MTKTNGLVKSMGSIYSHRGVRIHVHKALVVQRNRVQFLPTKQQTSAQKRRDHQRPQSQNTEFGVRSTSKLRLIFHTSSSLGGMSVKASLQASKFLSWYSMAALRLNAST